MRDQINLNEDLEMENDESKAEKNEELFPLENFKLTTTPNDFNIATIISFLDAGIIKIPEFQRNFVWDMKKSSRLIESLIIGLPIPQMFLFEKARNQFYVIDGQQRLMSLYFFYKGRFPKKDFLVELKNINNSLNSKNFIPESILADNSKFEDFILSLNTKSNPKNNRLHGQKYATLDSTTDLASLNISTIRNMIIKPSEESTNNLYAMFEIFNRLNSGGMNLNNQEIRMSLFFSEFMKKMVNMNENPVWRRVFGDKKPDLRFNDIEYILRLFTMALAGGENPKIIFDPENRTINYPNSILGFLNNMGKYSQTLSEEQVQELDEFWKIFMTSIQNIENSNFSFSSGKTNKISITFFEAVFYAAYDKFSKGSSFEITNEYLENLRNDSDFKSASSNKTTSRANINRRLRIASDMMN